jgi:cell wall-associated NlpC family hydrolase
VRGRLGSLPHVGPAVPVALATAAVLVVATGASAVSLRATSSAPAKPVAAAAPTSPHRLTLPAAPAAATVPGGISTAGSRTVSLTVPKPRHLVTPTLLVTSVGALTAHEIAQIRHLEGVSAIAGARAGAVNVGGHEAFVLGADPAKLRPWTPRLTAASQPLWQSIAAGELTASFDMGHDAKLPLGQTVAAAARHTVDLRIGAFASVGMAGVDAVVSSTRAAQLGIARGSALLVSAPHADALALRDAVRSIVGKRGHVGLLRQMVVIRDAGEFLTRAQITTVLQAAASRVGVPYVWGATGPDSFDCSGLVLWSFARAGIRMPRVSQQQWFAGPHVPYSAALPGDLLFWHYDPTDPTNIDHVAIYAGNGMMLVAPHTGDVVKYVPVPLANMAGVVRVDPGIASQI